MNISVQIFVWTYVFDSLGYIPRSGIARSHSKFYILTFWVAVRLFSKVTGLKSWRGEAIWPDGLNFYFIKNFILHVIFFIYKKRFYTDIACPQLNPLFRHKTVVIKLYFIPQGNSAGRDMVERKTFVICVRGHLQSFPKTDQGTSLVQQN